VVVKPKPNLYLKVILGVALIVAGGLSFGGAWLAVKLILDPESVVWINRFLPAWTQLTVAVENPPKTLAQIQTSAQAQDLRVGTPIKIETETLIPISKYRNSCNCNTIIALQVYQNTVLPQQEPGYRLLREVEVKEIEEFFVVAPLINQEPDAPFSSNDTLPLTDVETLPKTTADGIWLNLSGTKQQGDQNLTYGHIFHYNPDTTYLGAMLTWTSPQGKRPTWQEVTNGKPPELVVDQTWGFEPQFQVYQLQERKFAPNPVDLQPINLRYTPKFSANQEAYNRGLSLSRQGLWSPALRKLETLKQNYPQAWDSPNQEQLDLIALHAKRTKAQCEKPWASPSQQILACIIDGNWQASLTVFQAASPEMIAEEITTLLKNDQGRIRQRLETALNINPSYAVIAWKVLLEASTEGDSAAQQWLEEFTANSPQIQRGVLAILDQWQFAIAQTSPQSLPMSRIIGVARPLKDVNLSDWLQPEANTFSSTQLPQQQWYVVEVQSFDDGREWLTFPFTFPMPRYAPEQQLWHKLGLDLDPWLQLVSWKQETQNTLLVRVRGVQRTGDSLKLLVSSKALASNTSPVLFAYSNAALDWRSPGSVTLNSLQQLQPDLMANLLPSLWDAIAANSTPDLPANPSNTEILAEVSGWLVKPTDLTGNDKPEILIELYQDGDQLRQPTFGESELGQVYTLIFSDTGQLVYNELSQDTRQQLIGIAKIGKQSLPNLVIKTGNTYVLKDWSRSQKAFQE
jgi:hypothetical protein